MFKLLNQVKNAEGKKTAGCGTGFNVTKNGFLDMEANTWTLTLKDPVWKSLKDKGIVLH